MKKICVNYTLITLNVLLLKGLIVQFILRPPCYRSRVQYRRKPPQRGLALPGIGFLFLSAQSGPGLTSPPSMHLQSTWEPEASGLLVAGVSYRELPGPLSTFQLPDQLLSSKPRIPSTPDAYHKPKYYYCWALPASWSTLPGTTPEPMGKEHHLSWVSAADGRPHTPAAPEISMRSFQISWD